MSRTSERWTNPPPPPDEGVAGPDADPEAVARRILLEQLTGRARSRAELADKLRGRGVPDEVAERLLTRFTEVGLIDDAAFAHAWATSRQSGRGLAKRALALELRRKGIDEETVAETLSGLDPEAEEAAARQLLRKKMRSMRGLPREVATRRLLGALARKGHSG
ncbi:MAG: regulatory protein RecX, partial [Nocardioides sp.]